VLPSVCVVGAVQEALRTPAWPEAAIRRTPPNVIPIARNPESLCLADAWRTGHLRVCGCGRAVADGIVFSTLPIGGQCEGICILRPRKTCRLAAWREARARAASAANEKARRQRDDELRILALAVKLAAEALERRLGES
jgi:hypothetical protein